MDSAELQTERKRIADLRATLTALPFCDAVHSVTATAGETAIPSQEDAVLHCMWARRTVELVLLVRTNIYPRDAREILWRMDALTANRPDAVPVLVADAISATAKEMLRDRRAAYFDAGGSLFLCSEPVYVHIDRPSPRPMASRVQSLFRGSRAQVVHCLLLAPRTWFGATHLAEQAGVSPGTASVVLRHLEQHEWVHTRGRGPTKQRRVADAGCLLDAWTRSNEAVRPFSVRDYYVPVVPEQALALELQRAFTAHGGDYALTGESAAQRYAPFLSTVSRIHCLVAPRDGRIDSVLRDLDARRVDQGANLSVTPAPFPGAFASREQVDGVWLASPVIVYLDLLRVGGRGREMARHLRRERIGY
ncbi:MAG: type IV toxin-antitoxin system AbiEi family antitoxin [Gammaproteobacteria bacterium]|nr:type IV toxin-antitoxin system AbiEi family antitoxin [Gammaproteobacteria bacterium]